MERGEGGGITDVEVTAINGIAFPKEYLFHGIGLFRMGLPSRCWCGAVDVYYFWRFALSIGT